VRNTPYQAYFVVEQAKGLLLLKKSFLYHDLLSVSIDTSHAMVKVQVAIHPQREMNIYLFHCTRNSIAIDVSECFVKYMQKAFDLVYFLIFWDNPEKRRKI
jgi:hypothetical protein